MSMIIKIMDIIGLFSILNFIGIIIIYVKLTHPKVFEGSELRVDLITSKNAVFEQIASTSSQFNAVTINDAHIANIKTVSIDELTAKNATYETLNIYRTYNVSTPSESSSEEKITTVVSTESLSKANQLPCPQPKRPEIIEPGKKNLLSLLKIPK